ncbi:hypothetical protein AB4039_35790 [Streptomyces sp. M-16]|uniref:hypothetical protein n=1 Tax=Streptomyces sp. M-16 TaxID=3233040 RepID=UPI003F97174F
MAISFVRKLLLVGLAAAIAGTTTVLSVAEAAPTTATTGEMPYAIEDFSYPNAAKIKEDTKQQLILKRGNGNLLYIPCTGSEDIKIESTAGQAYYCFDIKAKPAYVELELPSAYGIWTKADPVHVTIEADGKSTSLDAPANRFTGYGEAGANGTVSTLIELRVAG